MIMLTILLMAGIIFLSRYGFLEPRLPITLNTATLKFLSYSAPAVLTAIWGPIVFVSEHSLNINWQNNYLLCAVISIVLAITTRNTLLTTILSMAIFFGLRFINIQH
ncbi:MAG: branched-subunit amino acid transport protein [Oceanicoccus sp.]|jgi:branched-subunit amino acid transport protein